MFEDMFEKARQTMTMDETQKQFADRVNKFHENMIYTGDTKIRLSQLKKMTEDARRTYKVGERSETNPDMIKTSNGWRNQPQKGGAGGEKKEEPKTSTENKSRSEAYKSGERLAEPAEQRQKKGYNSWVGVLSGYDDESLINQRKELQESINNFEEDINRYDKNDLANAVYKKRIDQNNWQIGGLKAIDEEIKNRGIGEQKTESKPAEKKEEPKPAEKKTLAETPKSNENKNMTKNQQREVKAAEANKQYRDFYDNTGLKGRGGYEEALARNEADKEDRKQDNLKAGKRDDSMFKQNDKVEFSRGGHYLNGKIEKVQKDWEGNVDLYVRGDDGGGYWVETSNITKHEPSEKELPDEVDPPIPGSGVEAIEKGREVNNFFDKMKKDWNEKHPESKPKEITGPTGNENIDKGREANDFFDKLRNSRNPDGTPKN